MPLRLAILAALAACAAAAHAAPLIDRALTQDEVKVRKLRIEQGYDSAQARCKRVQGAARELCNEQARGDRDIQLAELDMQAEPTADHDEKVRLAKAGAQLATSMVKCKELEGEERALCRQDAKRVYEEAKADAALQKEVVAQELRSELTVRDNTIRAERIVQAEYKAARERCGMLPDEGRANCLADVQKRFARD